jgi:hypothetical protein
MFGESSRLYIHPIHLTNRTRFFDDIELLRQRWHSENIETVADLSVGTLFPMFYYHSWLL